MNFFRYNETVCNAISKFAVHRRGGTESRVGLNCNTKRVAFRLRYARRGVRKPNLSRKGREEVNKPFPSPCPMYRNAIVPPLIAERVQDRRARLLHKTRVATYVGCTLQLVQPARMHRHGSAPAGRQARQSSTHRE